MAIEVGVRCDGCDILGDVQQTAKRARVALKRVGWKNKGKVDICPSCQDASINQDEDPGDR